ncbi:MAG: DUF4342 domain-containing protein [Trueperaceae bacterium]
MSDISSPKGNPSSPETPITAQPMQEPNTATTSSSQHTSSTNTSSKDSISDMFDNVLKTLQDGLRNINKRQVVLNNRMGQSMLRLPLLWAIIIGVISFLLQIVPILVIAVIIALVTKHKFAFEFTTKSKDHDTPTV